MKHFKKNLIILCVCLLTIILPASSTQKAASKDKVSKKERNAYFAKSAFVGSSTSLGLKIYFNAQGKGFLGNPKMLVMGCYSFYNDKNPASPYRITYQGKKYMAKDAIASSGVKRVFISMGTNDLWKPAADTYKDYVAYVKGIRKKNRDVVIFIESTTPMCTSSNKKYLNNTAINTLNRKMEQYCSKHKNMYYVDVTKGMRDSSGGLKSSYSTDHYVHMNMTGYKIWTKNVTDYVTSLLLQEKNASHAVKQAAKTLKIQDYNKAKLLVSSLESSTTKDMLKKRLKQIYKRYKNNQHNNNPTPQNTSEPKHTDEPKNTAKPTPTNSPKPTDNPNDTPVPLATQQQSVPQLSDTHQPDSSSQP